MADVDAKVNMSLDDIIKMERMRKSSAGRGGNRGAQRRARSTSRGRNSQQRRSRSRGRGGGGGNRNRGRSNSRPRYNKRGPWRRFGPSNRGKRFSSGNSFMTRSRSNVSLNRNGLGNSPRGRSRTRATYPTRRGGRFMARSRSRSRNRMNNYGPPSPGYLKRTNSMPNLSDPGSVYSRLGYQNSAQTAYRNRVKRAKNTLLNSQNKNLRLQHSLNMIPPMTINNYQARRYSSGNINRAEQIMRAQKRAAYEQRLMRINAQRATPEPINYLEDLNEYAQRHPAMALFNSPSQSSSERRGRSPFRRGFPLKEPKLEPNYSGPLRSRSASRQRRARSRSRSRSRARQRQRMNSISIHGDDDLEDRSFSEVMYSLSNNFGVTGRTLNDRFSVF